MPVRKIASFAFLDLETTCLPSLNFNKTKITEIALHGIASENIQNAENSNIPRIVHKLTLLFNPQMRIETRTEEITGLNNFMLENESCFNENAANTLINFLKHMRQPVCLVAHNGNNFDFPVLKQALERVNLQLPEGVLCVDSYEAIKILDLTKEETKEKCIQECEGVSKLADDITALPESESDSEEKPCTNWQKFNETTPKRPPNNFNIERKRKRAIQNEEANVTPKKRSPTMSEENSNHKLGDTDYNSKPLGLGFKSRRSLFNHPHDKGFYKLATIYERLFNEEPDVAHHAEADVIMLEKIILRYGNIFKEYAEECAIPFKETKILGAR